MSAHFVSLSILLFLISPAWASASGYVRFQQSAFFSSSQPYFRSSAESLNSSISLGVNGQWTHRKFNFNLNGRDEYSATEDWNYLNLYEVTVDYRLARDMKLSLGRKILLWNEWEGPWGQGLFQPRYLQNKLRAEPAGLTGAFAQAKSGRLAAAVGALVNIPDFGAHFTIRNHRFYSANPWFTPPASTFVFNSKVQDIRYSIDKPEVSEVIGRPGVAAKVEWSEGSQILRLSYAYKPAPQFLLGFPARNQVVIGDKADYMRVNIEPRVFYHRLTSLDYLSVTGPWAWSVSLAHENPLMEPFAESDMSQQVGPAWISAGKISRPLEDEGPDAARVSLGFFKVSGGDLPDRGDFAGETRLFERRYQFNEAYMVGVFKPFRGLARFPVETQGRLIYDRKQNGIAVIFNSGVAFSRTLRADFEMDILGLLARDAEIQDNFLSAYRANDRFGVGLSYVF